MLFMRASDCFVFHLTKDEGRVKFEPKPRGSRGRRAENLPCRSDVARIRLSLAARRDLTRVENVYFTSNHTQTIPQEFQRKSCFSNPGMLPGCFIYIIIYICFFF